MLHKAFLIIAVAVLAIMGVMLLVNSGGAVGRGGPLSICTIEDCQAVPLRALVDKYPIRYCIEFPHGEDVHVALMDSVGWEQALGDTGVELTLACNPPQLISVRIVRGWTGDWAAQVNYSGYRWYGDSYISADLCILTINDRQTTDINQAIYWDAMSSFERRSLINHEFGHCLGLADGGPGIMSWQYNLDRPTEEDKDTLRTQFPYATPLWWSGKK